MKPKLVVQAGAQLDDWGTPEYVIAFVRKVYGNKSVALDLASNKKANEVIQARRFYSLQRPCPECVAPPDGALVWCNPPGPVAKVRWFWDVWVNAVRSSGCGGFLVFNLDHLRALSPIQRCDRFVFVPWPKRLRFVGAPSQYNHPSGLVFAGGADVAATVRKLDDRMHPMVWSR